MALSTKSPYCTARYYGLLNLTFCAEELMGKVPSALLLPPINIR